MSYTGIGSEDGAFHHVQYHSDYKGYQIYREYNPLTDRPMMSYFAIKAAMTLHAKNLSGIKDRVTEAVQ